MNFHGKHCKSPKEMLPQGFSVADGATTIGQMVKDIAASVRESLAEERTSPTESSKPKR
jgi:hypothetical protein